LGHQKRPGGGPVSARVLADDGTVVVLSPIAVRALRVCAVSPGGVAGAWCRADVRRKLAGAGLIEGLHDAAGADVDRWGVTNSGMDALDAIDHLGGAS